MLQVLSIPEDIYYLLASHNQIRYVFGEGQNVLDRLDLSYNKLSTIRWLKDFKQINMLDLSFNEIEDLSAREFEQLEKLTILKLNNNRLLTFDVPSDAPPAVLRSLDLSHNRLVRLSYNQQQFEQLEDLYLDHNSLISVTLGVTRKFKNLKLAHNDWDCATLMKLFKNIRFGTVVDYNSEMVCPNEHERGICCKESDIPYLDRLLQFTAVVISHDKKILANSQCNPSSLPVIYPGALSTAELEKEIQIFKKELQSLEVNIEEKESQVTQNVHKIDELIRMYRVATGDNAEPSYNLEQVLEHLKRREQFTVNETIARYDQAKAKENELGPITYETNHLDATLNAKRSARMTMYMETAQLFKLVQKLQKEVNRIATNNMRMIT
ncbi:hypothetical protein ZHAS_00021178 [Anopheles sinensis]|uniref:Leucine-rich immune protein (Short) n=1 Tax=Anopheles sinensis TaxID=74873 RepID=A0A084WRL4_ANOSI|nr:hypothetical protein ZHAS_00021178 [Anopheles sinensis]